MLRNNSSNQWPTDLSKPPCLGGLSPLVPLPEGEWNNPPGAGGDVVNVQHHALPLGVGGAEVRVTGGH